MPEQERPAKGDWVQVWGQVDDPRPHPEDVAVRFQSHMEDYVGLVRVEHVEDTGMVPSFVERCTSLGLADLEVPDGAMVRCTLHHDHHQAHSAPNGKTWNDMGQVGYFEEA